MKAMRNTRSSVANPDSLDTMTEFGGDARAVLAESSG